MSVQCVIWETGCTAENVYFGLETANQLSWVFHPGKAGAWLKTWSAFDAAAGFQLTYCVAVAWERLSQITLSSILCVRPAPSPRTPYPHPLNPKGKTSTTSTLVLDVVRKLERGGRARTRDANFLRGRGGPLGRLVL
eukprot:gene15108-biopygen12692